MKTQGNLFLTAFILTAAVCGSPLVSAAEQPRHHETLTGIQEKLDGLNFRIAALDAQRKSEILTTASEEAIRADIQNAVHGMEMRYTLRLKTVLIIPGEDGSEKDRFEFGHIAVFYTLREKQGEKIPVDLGVSFEFPDAFAVTTLAQTKISEKEVDVFLSEEFKEKAGRQLSEKLAPEFAALSGSDGEAFKKALEQFITAFTQRVLTQSRESLLKMMNQYPMAEQSILKEAQEKYAAPGAV